MMSVMVNTADCGSANAREFIRLLAAHSQSIYRYIFALLPDPDDAQDVYQDSVMTLWEKFGEYRCDLPFLPWACRFAHFKVLAHRKKNRRQPALLDDDVLEILAEEQSAGERTARGTAQAIARLPGKTHPQGATASRTCAITGGRRSPRSPSRPVGWPTHFTGYCIGSGKSYFIAWNDGWRWRNDA